MVYYCYTWVTKHFLYQETYTSFSRACFFFFFFTFPISCPMSPRVWHLARGACAIVTFCSANASYPLRKLLSYIVARCWLIPTSGSDWILDWKPSEDCSDRKSSVFSYGHFYWNRCFQKIQVPPSPWSLFFVHTVYCVHIYCFFPLSWLLWTELQFSPGSWRLVCRFSKRPGKNSITTLPRVFSGISI